MEILSCIFELDFENCDVIDWSIFDEVDDAHLEYIQESLETGAPLDLIEFTDMEMKELAKALKVSKVLHRVNLDCSQITDCGANYLAEVLKESDCVLTGNIKNIKIMLPPQF